MRYKFFPIFLAFCFTVSNISAQTAPFPPAEDPGSQDKAIVIQPVLDVEKQPIAPGTTIERGLLDEEETDVVVYRSVGILGQKSEISYYIRTATPQVIRRSGLKNLYRNFINKTNFLYAQQIPPDARSSDPGSQEKAMIEQMEPREPAKEPKAPPVNIKEEEGELVPEGFPFLVKDIKVVGNTVISSKEINKIVDPYEGKEISLTELKNVAKLITRLYQSKGYLTSRAFIPPQEVVEGIVTLEILEAKLGEVRIEGNKRIPAKWIIQRLRLKHGSIFQVKLLERDLIRMNKNPDVEIRAVLVRGKEPGTTDIVLTVKEKFFMHAAYTFDNLGTKFSGTLRHNIDFSANGILNLNDRLSGKVILTDSAEFVGEVADYVTPINEYGTSAQMTFSNVNIHLGEGLTNLDIRGRATVFSPAFTQTLHESEKWEANFVTGFDFKTVKTRVLATEISDDELRELKFGPNLTQWDKWGRSVLISNFVIGFPSFLGASSKKDPHASRPQTGGQFQIYQITGARVQNLPLGLIGFFRISTQFTPDRLVTAEQFRIGGMNTVRGYPEGDYLGDYGFNPTAELRIPPYFFPKEMNFFGKKFVPREMIQFVAFCDIAKAYLNKPLAQEDSSKLLIGVGPGVLVDIMNHVTARVFCGIPVGERTSEENGARLHFVLTVAW